MSTNDIPDLCEDGDGTVLEAKEVYVLMKNDYRISRNIRAEWFFKNLNKTVLVNPLSTENECTDEIQIISAIPKYLDSDEIENAGHGLTIKIVPDTKIHFLSSQYRLVFCLDMSPSITTVDVQHNSIYIEEIYPALEQSLKNVSKPFYVPGSQYVFNPQIFVAVIAHIPNVHTTVPQVLIQGWILTSNNVDSLLKQIQIKLQDLVKRVEQAALNVREQQIQFMMPQDASCSIIDGTIDGNKMIKKVVDLSADLSTLNLIKYGVLALQLLPENCSAGIIVVTDGILSFPTSKTLDSLLTQLRNSTIACSFLQLGSSYYPFSCFGRVPYKELMQFIAAATCGAYFPSSRDIVMNSQQNEMNLYHQAFLLWNFQKTEPSFFLEGYDPMHNRNAYWSVENPHFYTVANQSRVSKRQSEGNLKISLDNLLSCRLREGYTVKNISVDEIKNTIEVRLVLPWMLSTNIEYLVSTCLNSNRQRKSSSDSMLPSCHYEVIVDGCYEFLHDVTCSDKKPIKSFYRQTVINLYWSYVKNLTNTDQILIALHSFSRNPIYYTVPDNIKNGLPLFHFASNSTMPVLSSKNVANPQFSSFWKQLCMLDVNVWQKWMHAHRIGLILQHDMPLPKNLHHANTSGRYVHVQCRQATTALNSFLREYSSFALVENHSYIKLLFDEPDKPPMSFFVIRVTSKPPCVVIRLAFLGGLPGKLRNEIIKDLRNRMLSLKLPKRAFPKDTPQSVSSNKLSCSQDLECCYLLKKPVEKVLIRYEKLPSNFLMLLSERQFNPREMSSQRISDHLYTDALITLSKYLHHQRWVWTLQYETNTSLNLESASKILYTLTKIRLQEGFHFSHSSFGVIYMVMEIPMQICDIGYSTEEDAVAPQDTNCIVQYILFPPHTNTTLKDSISEEDDTELTEADGELQLITECWVEPQHGTTNISPEDLYLSGLQFHEISEVLHKRDLETFSVLTTFEHLSTLCQKKSEVIGRLFPMKPVDPTHCTLVPRVTPPSVGTSSRPLASSISQLPYCFNLLSLLTKCHQTEILFPSLYETKVNEDQEGPKTNEQFFDIFLTNLKAFHDGELELGAEECLNFLFQVHHRDRDLTKNPAIPFPHPDFQISDFSLLKQNPYIDANNCKLCNNIGCSLSEFSDSSRRPLLLDYPNFNDKDVPRWKCYLKGFSPSHFILLMTPASYNDLKKMYASNEATECSQTSEGLSASIQDKPSTSSPNSNQFDQVSEVMNDSELTEVCDTSENSSQRIMKPAATVEKLLMIPVYVYNCTSSLVVSQLVMEDEDMFKDSCRRHSFKYEACLDESDASYLDQSTSFKLPGAPSFRTISDSSECNKKRKRECETMFFEDQCLLLDKCFSKAFVYGVYRSLMHNLDIHKLDAIAAIDEICEESLIEIDITEFVFMICGHVKDFTTKHSMRQMHIKGESADDMSFAGGLHSEDGSTEKNPGKGSFPLSLLQKHQPCEHLHQKHLDIKEKFAAILKSFFKVIPTRTDYFFFNPEEDTEELSQKTSENGSKEDNLNFDEVAISFDEDILDEEPDKVSSVFAEEGASPKSFGNTMSSLTSVDRNSQSNSSEDLSLLPPLFVHFTCSVRQSKRDIKSCSLSSLPTCLKDMISCVDSDSSELDLDKIRITLDITCLTVPSDIDSPALPRRRQCSTSFSSSSPVLESESYQKQPIPDDENESVCSDIPTDTIQGGSLQNLPVPQQEAVQKCIKKIKWLLQDEKASAALNSFPITSETLSMVSEHVTSSVDKPCCIIKEIPLVFVYGSENSLDKFNQAFERMSPLGYRLNEVNKTFYLVLDAESAKKLNSPFGSLVPPLGIAEKYLIIKRNPHGDDRMELKRIGDEVKDSSMFQEKELSLMGRIFDLDILDDDGQNSKMESKAMFDVLLDRRTRKLQKQEEDTETEDGNENQRPKSKFPRKNSVRRASVNARMAKRAVSSPSVSFDEKSGSNNGRPQTAPPNLLAYNERGVSEVVDKVSPMSGKSAPSDWNRTSLSVDNSNPMSADNVTGWGSEAQVVSLNESSPDFNVESKDLHLNSSMLSSSRCKQLDYASSPVVFSEIDYGSNIGSCHFSNTEDGYDGDSSDTGSDWDWLTFDTHRPVLPKFWLIMNICEMKVVIYFHMRHCDENDEELIQSKAVFTEVISIIENICKEVNQILLLQSLYETRMCSHLLVPQSNDDIWKHKDREYFKSMALNPKHSHGDPNPNLEVQEKYLEATLKFKPGTFECPLVWVTHFKLHHRLSSPVIGSDKSKGIQALRSVLSTFSVNNRENMFVYQEESNSVFYLKLFEEICEEHHGGKFKTDDNLSLLGSCWSSMQSIPLKKTPVDCESETDFRPRVNSGASDGTRQDSLSTTSASRKPQKCIALHVYGIGEVGSAITSDLEQVLQSRLTESVLDIIIMMLSRNPKCMLTPEDVQFIQNPNSPPKHEIHFTLPVKLLCYARSIHIYLRQNMLYFLHNPNYTDNKKENHFKVYSSNHGEWAQVDDRDVFLYHSQQASGYSGGKGIACIVLSLVTGQGNPYQHFNSSLPNPYSYRDGLCESDFEDLTFTSVYTIKKSPTPGPVALIRFQLWSVGRDAKEHLELCLQNAVRHALWDLLLEYRALTAPVSEFGTQDDSLCYSEPTTPVRARRSGRSAVDPNFPSKDFSSDLQNSKEMSSSVPDIPTKGHSPQSMMKEMSVFKFNSGPQSAKPEFYSEPAKQAPPPDRAAMESEQRNLNYMFHSVMKPFLQFGDELGCPCLSKEVFDLPSRHSIVTILKETQSIIKAVTREVFPKVFLRVQNTMTADTEFIPFNPQTSISSSSGSSEDTKPGTTKCFIVIGRNVNQWKAYMGHSDFLKFQETCSDTLKIYQKNQTYIFYSSSHEMLDSLPSSPTPISRSNSIATLGSPRSKGSNIQVADSLSLQGSPPVFVPRQTLLLMFVEDKKLTLFLYNWCQDITTSLTKQMRKLIQWHHQRNCFLDNIVMQKLGLFHAQTCPQKAGVQKAVSEEKPPVTKPTTESSTTTATTTTTLPTRIPFTAFYMDQLIHSHTPPREGHTSSARSASVSLKAVFVLDTLKNNRPPQTFQQSASAHISDPVTAHGIQFHDALCAQKRDMQDLYNMWQTRGASLNHPFIDRMPRLLKRVARMSHYCLTPILFSPSWRWKVAPVRDHTLHPLEQSPSLQDRSSDSGASSVSNRSRHSSGSSLKNLDGIGAIGSNTRSRRFSGATHPGSNQASPKLRMKNPTEEAWHNTVCRHYLQEYVQYLHTIGFVSLQTSESSHVRSVRRSGGSEDDKSLKNSESHPQHRNTPPFFYLIKSMHGGLLVFEIGLSDPYAYGHLYSIECERFNARNTRTISSQFTPAFLDELDKIKLLMHLHSFTYDYHLRTIHSYISGRQLIFRHGYHLTSFLDDFIKYYQKTPNCARNLLYAGVLTISDTTMSGDQLYNYIISHNQLYGMTVLRMVPVIQDSSSSSIDTEFALVELSAQKASYKDVNDVCQMGNFDIGLLISHNTIENLMDKTSLMLNYYIILTSQRDLYPKILNFGTTLGTFKKVRFGSTQTSSAFSSRKTSTVSVVNERETFESSGEDSTSSTGSRTRHSAMVRSMCDEDVTYLGYFSNQETMMEQVIQAQAQAASDHLQEVVRKASVHCRRDFLWSSLLPRSFKEDSNTSRDHVSATSYADFSELLTLVTRLPLDRLDEMLTPFANMHLAFYHTLAGVLRTKYADNHREFFPADGGSLSVVVTHVRCPDSFMLLSIDWRSNKTELCLVFREPLAEMEQESDKPNQRIVALQSLVEEFVNLCSFHLWTSLL